MSKREHNYIEAVKVLEELHNQFPSYSLGRHIATAFADYGDVWDLTDKEFLFALQKYQAELSIDIAPEADVERILKEGMDLDNILKEDEEEDF